MSIENFTGPYFFMNNAFKCEVQYRDRIYDDVWTALEASRIDDESIREKLSEGELTVEDTEHMRTRQGWEEQQLSIMYRLLSDKFTAHQKLGQLLVMTQDKRLKYHDPADPYWSKHLGPILERVRLDIRISRRR